MAEGILGGILGEEEEKPETEASSALIGAEAFALAVAAKLAGTDPAVARKTEIFLDKQAQILETQNGHLTAEHEARLHFLRGQAREVDIRRFGLRLRVAFQLFLALAATVLGVGIAILIRDAVTSRRVVIEPFRAPPALATRGIDGAVVAGGLLDELTRLQDATRSSSAARDLTGGWNNNLRLEVPETGVSIAEISRLLRERFGHDARIEGDLIETPLGGLELTVRGNKVLAKTFGESGMESRKLTIEAAEYVYSQSQPARWATYLNNEARYAEAIAFCQTSMASADPEDRPRLLNTWALAMQATGGSPEETLLLLRAALKLKPDLWVAHVNTQNSLMLEGNEEAAWRAGEEMRSTAGGRPGRAPETEYANWDTLTWNLQPFLSAIVIDAETNGGAGTGASAAGPAIADVHARLHDPEAAKLALETTRQDPHDPTVAAMSHFVRGMLATEVGDVVTAVNEMEAYGIAYADPAVSSNNPGYQCFVAPAEEAAGHPDKADALLKGAGTFVDCYRFRADILDGRGDWAGAQKAYADAVALAPDLPAAYFSWGVALAKHKDFSGAEAKLKDANQRGPHWADPLKAWGDVLIKQNNIKGALAKYDEALKYAPNWKELKDVREALAKQKG